MMKKISIIILTTLLFLVLLSPTIVQAQNKITILDSSVEAEFPSGLSFNLSAKSDVNIIDIRLCYVVDQASFAQVTSEVYIEFVPATNIDAHWEWDMRKTGGLPPGSNVDYWWIVVDTNNNRVETTPSRIQFDDNRYPWQSLTQNEITIYWYQGNKTFAQEIMLSAQQALNQLANDTGAKLNKPVQLYIYADATHLQSAMIYPQEWTGGVAYTRYGILAIGISPSNPNWGKRAIAHELTHLTIHQMTLNPYNNLPTWLDEGLAMYTEGPLSPEYIAYLNKAAIKNNLISTQSLSSPFSAYAEESYLSYAQSYSLVEFLISNYGQDKMLSLLNNFRQGSSYNRALEKVYGFDMAELDTLWKNYY
ncbi:MAG: peptidase MA family metallohydrolase [Dehalococcoidales bacterium]|nr:peptidase MA family metallohydrolase [Dehalococcoidales bacterium]